MARKRPQSDDVDVLPRALHRPECVLRFGVSAHHAGGLNVPHEFAPSLPTLAWQFAPQLHAGRVRCGEPDGNSSTACVRRWH